MYEDLKMCLQMYIFPRFPFGGFILEYSLNAQFQILQK